jgi:hypothetical protein
MTNNLEIEIKKHKKQDESFIFISEDNDKKRIYLIYSLELKRRLRELVFPFGVSGRDNDQYQGKSNQGDKVFYQQDKEEKPDKLVLISRKYSKAITDGNEELLEQQEIEKEKKEQVEKKRLEGL